MIGCPETGSDNELIEQKAISQENINPNSRKPIKQNKLTSTNR